MKRRTILGVAALLALAAAGSTRLYAQGVTTGALTGTVSDASGQILAGVQVQLRNPATGYSVTTTTRASGLYLIQGVEPGTGYEVTVRRIGLEPKTRPNVSITLNQTRREDFKMAAAAAVLATVQVTAALADPIINASIDGDNVIYKKDINLGVAVALDEGLIVPVIKNADEKNLLGLSRAIADVAERARARRLNPDEVHGGTFTITNPGQFGAQFGMPIINQPQVAILGVGTIEKRPVVVDEAIGIRTMAYLTLGYDHRLVDGAVADQFMADVKQRLECFDPSDC